jgi:3-phytase
MNVSWTLRATAAAFLAILPTLACGPREDAPPEGTAGSPDPPSRDAALVAPGLEGVPVLSERWVSAWDSMSNLDSPAVWTGAQGSWVIATAKDPHDLWVFDASSGALLRRVGGPGSELGRFQRPNGIAVAGDLLLVVERDNRRVQLLSLPDFHPLGAFGEEDLIRPYGITLYEAEDDALHLFVTDDYGNEVDPPEGGIPEGDFTERVKHFVLQRRDGAFQARLVRAFGEADGPGALRVVESIQVDEVHGILLVADEHAADLKVYDLDGRYLERDVGADLYRFGDPEGVMLYRCGNAGYWILTDQGPDLTVFHILDRESFQHLGSFTGAVTANTDGISLVQEGIPGLGDGALFAVHDDGGLTAFAWQDISRALGLRSGCAAAP